MGKKKTFTLDQAKIIGEILGIRWDKFDVAQFRAGLGVELEHGAVNPTTDVTNDDPLRTGKIALAHLAEFPDYYTRLAKMEEAAKSFWNLKKVKKKMISGSRKSLATEEKSSHVNSPALRADGCRLNQKTKWPHISS